MCKHVYKYIRLSCRVIGCVCVGVWCICVCMFVRVWCVCVWVKLRDLNIRKTDILFSQLYNRLNFLSIFIKYT